MRLITFYTLLSLLISCGPKTSKVSKPNDLIDREKFTELLVETSLLEGHLTNVNTNIPEIRDQSLGKYKNVFKQFEVSNEQYQKSYSYYVQQDYFKDIIQTAIDKVTEKEEYLKNLPEIKQMSFEQLKTVLKQDGFDKLLLNDTTLNHLQKIDTISTYYKVNPDQLKIISIDSLSFQYSLNRFRDSKQLFKTLEKSMSL